MPSSAIIVFASSQTGTFANLHLLETIYLDENLLQSLPAGAVQLTTPTNDVHFSNNSIGYIAVDALSGQLNCVVSFYVLQQDFSLISGNDYVSHVTYAFLNDLNNQ